MEPVRGEPEQILHQKTSCFSDLGNEQLGVDAGRHASSIHEEWTNDFALILPDERNVLSSGDSGGIKKKASDVFCDKNCDEVEEEEGDDMFSTFRTAKDVKEDWGDANFELSCSSCASVCGEDCEETDVNHVKILSVLGNKGKDGVLQSFGNGSISNVSETCIVKEEEKEEEEDWDAEFGIEVPCETDQDRKPSNYYLRGFFQEASAVVGEQEFLSSSSSSSLNDREFQLWDPKAVLDMLKDIEHQGKCLRKFADAPIVSAGFFSDELKRSHGEGLKSFEDMGVFLYSIAQVSLTRTWKLMGLVKKIDSENGIKLLMERLDQGLVLGTLPRCESLRESSRVALKVYFGDCKSKCQKASALLARVLERIIYSRDDFTGGENGGTSGPMECALEAIIVWTLIEVNTGFGMSKVDMNVLVERMFSHERGWEESFKTMLDIAVLEFKAEREFVEGFDADGTLPGFVRMYRLLENCELSAKDGHVKKHALIGCALCVADLQLILHGIQPLTCAAMNYSLQSTATCGFVKKRSRMPESCDLDFETTQFYDTTSRSVLLERLYAKLGFCYGKAKVAFALAIHYWSDEENSELAEQLLWECIFILKMFVLNSSDLNEGTCVRTLFLLKNVLIAYGEVLLSNDKYGLAIIAFEQSLALSFPLQDGSSQWLVKRMAVISESKSDLCRGIAYYSVILDELKGSNSKKNEIVHVSQHLAGLYNTAGMWAEAEWCLANALRFTPNFGLDTLRMDPVELGVALKLCDVLRAGHLHDKAIFYLEKLCEKVISSTRKIDVYIQLGEVFLERNWVKDATNILILLIQSKGTESVHFNRGSNLLPQRSFSLPTPRGAKESSRRSERSFSSDSVNLSEDVDIPCALSAKKTFWRLYAKSEFKSGLYANALVACVNWKLCIGHFEKRDVAEAIMFRGLILKQVANSCTLVTFPTRLVSMDWSGEGIITKGKAVAIGEFPVYESTEGIISHACSLFAKAAELFELAGDDVGGASALVHLGQALSWRIFSSIGILSCPEDDFMDETRIGADCTVFGEALTLEHAERLATKALDVFLDGYCLLLTMEAYLTLSQIKKVLKKHAEARHYFFLARDLFFNFTFTGNEQSKTFYSHCSVKLCKELFSLVKQMVLFVLCERDPSIVQDNFMLFDLYLCLEYRIASGSCAAESYSFHSETERCNFDHEEESIANLNSRTVSGVHRSAEHDIRLEDIKASPRTRVRETGKRKSAMGYNRSKGSGESLSAPYSTFPRSFNRIPNSPRPSVKRIFSEESPQLFASYSTQPYASNVEDLINCQFPFQVSDIDLSALNSVLYEGKPNQNAVCELATSFIYRMEEAYAKYGQKDITFKRMKSVNEMLVNRLNSLLAGFRDTCEEQRNVFLRDIEKDDCAYPRVRVANGYKRVIGYAEVGDKYSIYRPEYIIRIDDIMATVCCKTGKAICRRIGGRPLLDVMLKDSTPVAKNFFLRAFFFNNPDIFVEFEVNDECKCEALESVLCNILASLDEEEACSEIDFNKFCTVLPLSVVRSSNNFMTHLRQCHSSMMMASKNTSKERLVERSFSFRRKKQAKPISRHDLIVATVPSRKSYSKVYEVIKDKSDAFVRDIFDTNEIELSDKVSPLLLHAFLEGFDNCLSFTDYCKFKLKRNVFPEQGGAGKYYASSLTEDCFEYLSKLISCSNVDTFSSSMNSMIDDSLQADRYSAIESLLSRELCEPSDESPVNDIIESLKLCFFQELEMFKSSDDSVHDTEGSIPTLISASNMGSANSVKISDASDEKKSSGLLTFLGLSKSERKKEFQVMSSEKSESRIILMCSLQCQIYPWELLIDGECDVIRSFALSDNLVFMEKEKLKIAGSEKPNVRPNVVSFFYSLDSAAKTTGKAKRNPSLASGLNSIEIGSLGGSFSGLPRRTGSNTSISSDSSSLNSLSHSLCGMSGMSRKLKETKGVQKIIGYSLKSLFQNVSRDALFSQSFGFSGFCQSPLIRLGKKRVPQKMKNKFKNTKFVDLSILGDSSADLRKYIESSFGRDTFPLFLLPLSDLLNPSESMLYLMQRSHLECIVVFCPARDMKVVLKKLDLCVADFLTNDSSLITNSTTPTLSIKSTSLLGQHHITQDQSSAPSSSPAAPSSSLQPNNNLFIKHILHTLKQLRTEEQIPVVLHSSFLPIQ
eukprot:Nk52_evm38s279 gene=Nk52_evmTU38s279